MRRIIALAIVCVCGASAQTVFNPFTRKLDFTAPSAALAYPLPFSAVTTIGATALTHGQGVDPVVEACYDDATPRVVFAFTYTVSAIGDVVISWTGSKTGSCLISAGKSGPVGAAGEDGDDGTSLTASNTGTSGIGIFKQKSALDLQFYKINSTNNLITIDLSGTDFLRVTMNPDNFVNLSLTGNLTRTGIADGCATWAGGVLGTTSVVCGAGGGGGGGAGNVAAAVEFTADNRLIRTNGVGGFAVQESLVAIDDFGVITGATMPATAITAAPVGSIAAITVQAAIQELDNEKQAALGFSPVNAATVGAASGVASLDGSIKVPIAQIPTGSTGTTVSLGDHAHTGVYQLLDADLTAIAALSCSDGQIAKKAAGVWTCAADDDLNPLPTGGAAAPPYIQTMSGSSVTVAYATHLVPGPLGLTCYNSSNQSTWVAHDIDLADATADVAIGAFTGKCAIHVLGSGAITSPLSATIKAPTTGDTNLTQWKLSQPSTIGRVSCSTDQGTATIQLDERAEATPNTAGTNVMTASLVCDSDSQTTTSFTNASIAAEVPLNLQITAVSGTPGVVRVHVSF